MIRDPSLLDHLATLLPERQAHDVYLYAQHPDAVALLMSGQGEWHSDYGGSGCSVCHCNWDGDNDCHDRSCLYVEALFVLKDPRLQSVEQQAEEHAYAMSWRYAADSAGLQGEYRGEDGHWADATTHSLHDVYYDQHGVEYPPPLDDY